MTSLHPLRRILCSFLYPPSCRLSPPPSFRFLHRGEARPPHQRQTGARSYAQKSMQIQRKQQTDSGEIRNDVGLFSGTYAALITVSAEKNGEPLLTHVKGLSSCLQVPGSHRCFARPEDDFISSGIA